MSNEDVKAAARRVLEEIFPADDEIALVTATSADFVNHEGPTGNTIRPGQRHPLHAPARQGLLRSTLDDSPGDR